MKNLILVSGALLIALPSSAIAQKGATGNTTPQNTLQSDLQCLVAMRQLRGNADPKAKSAGGDGARFYLGKVLAAEPSIDLPTRLRGELARLNGQPAGPLVQRCLGEMNSRLAQLSAAWARPETSTKR